MGFRTPSAKQVYDYLFRLDDGSLTDQFGWSILLVGDYSDASREFLVNHCLDLCSRTADRVRFVFFSDAETEDLKWSSHRKGGRLGTVRRRLEFRWGRWDALRPQVFVPLATEREIVARLRHHQEGLVALPGAGEALRFAQRLGIGRHVPCIVVFTDVGVRTAHVLPFADRTAKQVHKRVRRWIDEYYAINRTELERWSEIEQEVERLSATLSRSLQVVRDWPESQRDGWRALRRVATLAATPPATVEAVDAARAIWADDEVDHALRALRRRLLDLGERGNVRHDAEAVAVAGFVRAANRLHATRERDLLTATMPALADVADARKLAELAAVLDDLDDVVRNVVHPYESDPEVFPLHTRVVAALAPRGGPSTVDGVRERSRAALKAHRQALRERDDAERAGLAARPHFDVFLAHHSADKPAVLEVCAELRRRGIRPWLDDEQIRPGTWFQDALQSVIRTTRAAAVFFGPAGFGKWQEAELRAFVERCVTEGIPVIPVLLPGVEEVPEHLLFLRQLNFVRFENSVQEKKPLRRLVWGVTGDRSVPDSAEEAGTDR